MVECSPATRAARVRFPDDAVPLYTLVVYRFIMKSFCINAHSETLFYFNEIKKKKITPKTMRLSADLRLSSPVDELMVSSCSIG